jgi:16S rRNA (uracil1498-N3)-methyltransferase
LTPVPEEPAASPEALLVSVSAFVYVGDLTSPVLDDAQWHHLLDVLRLGAGTAVAAGDGTGRWRPFRLVTGQGRERTGRDRSAAAGLEPTGPVRTVGPAEPPITVAFAPAKGDRPEWVVQKLTEVGVDRIVPLQTERSVVRWEGARAVRAVDRLRRIAREAAAQCRRAWIPEVTPVSTLEELCASASPPALAHFGGRAPTLDTPVIAVGPEGGWDDRELGLCPDRVSLGPTVLRAETAALAAATLLSSFRSRLANPCVTTLREENYTEGQGLRRG